LKFGEAGLSLIPEIQALDNLTVLAAVLAAIKTAANVDDLRRVYQEN
jgi:hypothetical protein